MPFEWDDEKNEANIQKHGIDFQDAEQVFQKPMLVRRDERKDYGEERWIGLGKMGNLTVVIVYARRSNHVRIISVRKANRKERKIYEERVKQD